jgi:hypothetical protein
MVKETYSEKEFLLGRIRSLKLEVNSAAGCTVYDKCPTCEGDPYDPVSETYCPTCAGEALLRPGNCARARGVV